jgi:opacity protein-like surface antigen
MKFLSCLLLVLILSASAYAADVDGKWTGTVSTGQGDIPVVFNFKSDGPKLTGTTTGLDGAEVPIADGKVDGNTITYTVTFDFGGMPLMLSYKGIVAKDEIKVTADVLGMTLDFVLKKSQ